MQVLLYLPSGDPAPWLADLRQHLPGADVRAWQPGDAAPADYVLAWKPPPEVLHKRAGLKGVFNLGAGVDALLRLLRAQPDLLPPGVPLIKLDDAGMGVQMVEYVTHAVVRRFRRFDEYEALKRQQTWRELPARSRGDWPVGVMGLGALGAQVAQALVNLGFPVRGWSRGPKDLPGVTCFEGGQRLPHFLDGLQVLVNMLPLTPDTEGILNRDTFSRLAPGSQLINVARGSHLVEEDLLAALADGRVACASLDVFREEPMPPGHPFWSDPRIEVTPHIAALTEREASVSQIVEKIVALERGAAVTGIVRLDRGY